MDMSLTLMDDRPSCLGCQKSFSTQRRLCAHEDKCRAYQQLLRLYVALPFKWTLDDGENLHPPSLAAEVNANPQFLGSSSETRETAKAVEADEGADKKEDGDDSDSNSGGAMTGSDEGEESEEMSEEESSDESDDSEEDPDPVIADEGEELDEDILARFGYGAL